MYYYEMIEAFQVQTATFSATTQLTIPDLANKRQGDHARAAELPFPVTPLAPIPLHLFNQIGARVAIQALRAMDGLARVRDRFCAVGSAP